MSTWGWDPAPARDDSGVSQFGGGDGSVWGGGTWGGPPPSPRSVTPSRRDYPFMGSMEFAPRPNERPPSRKESLEEIRKARLKRPPAAREQGGVLLWPRPAQQP